MTKEEAKKQIQKLVEKYERIAKEGKIKSYNEAQTRNEFIEPLFGFLGWDMRNLNTDNEVITEENVSGGRVDLAFQLGNIPVMFLEAKALKVDLDEWKWAEQAIHYSWNKSVTWAVLTDFEAIKIFNAEIPPKNITQNLFIEIKCQDFIDRFDQLWLLSKESFEKQLLYKKAEKWGKITKRKQVNEKLFEDLMAWRTSLTREFKKKNNLTNEELDEGVQRILDRLIFIRTAEDRKIEPNVLEAIYRSEKSGSYRQLVKVFRDFDEAFNSKLFAPHYCEEWKADDKVIANCLEGLYKTKDSYRYDFSIISADVLGGMYEQYLSYVQGRKSEEKKKSKRKSHGIYYTPKHIVDYIIKETLGEVLKKTKPKNISKIKVLDPACGSGSFLIASYDKILKHLTKQNPQTSLFAKFDILKENIFGVDLDSQAIEIAQLNLLLKVLSQKARLPELEHNLSSGNSLVSGEFDELEKYFGEKWQEQKPFNFEEEFKEVFEEGGFDVIIGNPPWVSLKGKHKSISFSDVELEYFYENLNANTYAPNFYEMFIWKGLSLLRDGGYFSFIVPDRFCANKQFIKLRKHILKNFALKKLWFKVDFPGIIADTVIFVIQNKKIKGNKIQVAEFPNEKFINIPQNMYLNNDDFSFFYIKENILKIFEEIFSNPRISKLSDFAKTTSGCGAKTSLLHEEKQNDSEIRIIKGINIGRFAHNGYFWFDFKPENLSGRTRDKKKLSAKNKVLLRKTGIDLIATFNDSSAYPEQSLYFIYDTDRQTLLYLLALINSKLINAYYQNFAITNRDSTPQLKNFDLDKFPIIKATEKEKEVIAKKSQTMLELHKKLHATSENTDKYNSLKKEIENLDQEIDEAIYKLYGLTNKEIKTLEEA